MKNARDVNFAIVGTNFISSWFVDAARLCDGVRVCAVYSRKRETGASFADKHGIEKLYCDYSELLSDKNIDAVYIASPIIAHKEQAIEAMRAGKHVLCEKMIAERCSSFLEMKEVSERCGVILLEAMRPEFDPAYSKVRELLPLIGKLRRVSFEFCQYSSRYDKFKDGITENAFNREMMNSALSDIGIYPLHMCISLFGSPKSVKSMSVKLRTGFDGAGCVLLGYGDMVASVTYSKITDSVLPSVIEGECGSILIDKISEPESITLKMRKEAPKEFKITRKSINMIYEISDFREMVLGIKDHRRYLSLTEKVMRVVDDVYRISRIF